MVLLDLSSIGILGQTGEMALARAGITSNKNPIPFSARSPTEWKGLHLGVAAATTRGFGTAEMGVLGASIADLLIATSRADLDPELARVKPQIAKLCENVGTGGQELQREGLGARTCPVRGAVARSSSRARERTHD